MASLTSFQTIARIVLITSCLALVDSKASNGLLLGSFIGCNSFGCRLAALESDVSQLKQQVARMSPPGMQGLNPYNQNMNQQGNMQNQNNQNQNANQQQQGQQQQQQGNNVNRVNFGLDYPVNQGSLQRVSSYPNGLSNQQFFRS